MTPRPFYEINPKTYLFERNDSPEEQVRQWVLFELLSTYGFNINDLQIEVKCKVGRKYFPADVVIYQNRSPIIVIECKRQEEENKKDEALKQAISYANFLKAEFVVFTNGNLWVVKKRIREIWHSVSDIPSNKKIVKGNTLTEWLFFFDDARPILYWMNRQVPSDQAYKVFDLMQRFFAGRTNLEDFDHDLLVGTELLLRVIAGRSDQIEHKIERYEDSTFHAAFGYFQTYFKKIGHDTFNMDHAEFLDFTGRFSKLFDDFAKLVKANHNIETGDAYLTRLNLVFMQYFYTTLRTGFFEKIKFQDISPNVISEFANFIEFILVTQLGLQLPSLLDEEMDMFKMYTSNNWYNKNGELL